MGDPTSFGNIPPCSVAIQAIVKAVQDPGHAASYVDATGSLAARTAIAKFHGLIESHSCTDNEGSNDKEETIVAAANNVIITNGCSGALEIILSSILDTVPTNTNRTKSVLFVPSPGFPLYTVLAESHGCSCVEYYPLRPDCNWEIDLPYLRQLLRKYHCSSSFCSTKSSEHASTQQSQLCLILTNPSNPTGTVFTKRHLTDVITLCNEYHVCVIADEVYGDLVFDNTSTNITSTPTEAGTTITTNGAKFYPVADIVAELEPSVQVPVITVSGLAKQFLLPGWRIGWIVFRDKYVSYSRQFDSFVLLIFFLLMLNYAFHTLQCFFLSLQYVRVVT